MKIKLIEELLPAELKQCEEIYYQTAANNSPETKYNYFDYYIENQANLFFVAISDRVLGYVCGLEDTLDHYEQLEMHRYLDYFREEIKLYPSHLHINVHPDARGMGVGRALLEHYEKRLNNRGVKGVHIITLEGEPNNSFYKSCQYRPIQIQKFHDKNLLLMAKNL